jgi:hypothetical protein
VAINTDIIRASLQTKLNGTTDDTESNDFLLLTKATEAIVGVVSVGEVMAEGTAQLAILEDEGDTQVALVAAEGYAQVLLVQGAFENVSFLDQAEVRSASIDMDDNVLKSAELTDYSETVNAMAANDVDCTLGNVQTKSVSSAVTLTFSNPPAAGKGGAFTLILTLSGSADVTWPANVKWQGGAKDVSTSGVDIFSFMTTDAGTTWYGFTSGQGMI